MNRLSRGSHRPRRADAYRQAGLTAVAMACIVASAYGAPPAEPNGSGDFDVVGVSFLGCAWNQGHAKASIVSQDGGFSYSVPGGSLWWFGDTFKGSRDEGGKPHFAGGGVSCDVAMLDKAETRVPPVLRYLTAPDGTVAQAIEFLPGESWEHHRIWPFGGLYLNGKSYVYYGLIELTGGGEWGFQQTASGLACSPDPLSPHRRIVTPKGWQFPVTPTSVVATGDWIYLYEVEKRDDRQGIWLSRVRPKQIEDPQAYQYHCGPGPAFSADKSKQVLFMPDVYGQVSIAWNEYLKRYVMACSSDFYHARMIRFHTAAEPVGPWSDVVAEITLPEYRQGKRVTLVYCSCFHPELFRDGGRIMNLTSSLQLKDSGFDANNEVVEVEVRPAKD